MSNRKLKRYLRDSVKEKAPDIWDKIEKEAEESLPHRAPAPRRSFFRSPVSLFVCLVLLIGAVAASPTLIRLVLDPVSTVPSDSVSTSASTDSTFPTSGSTDETPIWTTTETPIWTTTATTTAWTHITTATTTAWTHITTATTTASTISTTCTTTRTTTASTISTTCTTTARTYPTTDSYPTTTVTTSSSSPFERVLVATERRREAIEDENGSYQIDYQIRHYYYPKLVIPKEETETVVTGIFVCSVKDGVLVIPAEWREGLAGGTGEIADNTPNGITAIRFAEGVETVDIKVNRETANGRLLIREVFLPASVSAISQKTLGDLEALGSLDEITVSDDNPFFASRYGVLYDKDFTAVLCYPSN